MANPALLSTANSTGSWNKEISLILCGSCSFAVFLVTRWTLNYKLNARYCPYKFASLAITQTTTDHLPIFK